MNERTIAKRLPFLAGALVLQVALAGLLVWRGGSEAVAPQALLALESKPVTRIELADAEQTLVLQKQGEHWYLGEKLPADSGRVDAMIKSLAALKSAWPVAKSSSAQERFEVSSDKFQRKVSLANGDVELGTLLFGSSPAFRQVHVRALDQDEIYALNFDVFSVPASEDAWLDTALLRPAGEIQRISSGDTVLHKQDGKWSDAGKAKGEALAKALAELKVLGLAKDLASLDKPESTKSDGLKTLAFKVEAGDDSYAYELLSKDGQYYIRRGDFQPVFRLSKSEYDALAVLGAPISAESSG